MVSPQPSLSSRNHSSYPGKPRRPMPVFGGETKPKGYQLTRPPTRGLEAPTGRRKWGLLRRFLRLQPLGSQLIPIVLRAFRVGVVELDRFVGLAAGFVGAGQVVASAVCP